MYNYNTNNNKTNNMEENTMNEIKMANILNKLDAQGIPVTFSNQVPAWVKNNPEHYAMGLIEGGVPTNIMQKMFAEGAELGIGLMIELPMELRAEIGDDNYQKRIWDMPRKLNHSSEFQELVNYLRQKPQEAASLIRFCKNCLLAGNKPVRVLEDGTDKYFLCSNGKILVRNGEEFTVYYEGTVLPNINVMSDRQILDVLRATKETYENLTEEDYDDEEEYEEEEEDYDDEEEYEEEEEDYDDEEEYEEEEDLSNILITTARQILSNCSLDLRNHIEDLIEGIERAERNDNTIRKEALTDALASCLKAYKKTEWEGKCKKDEWNF